MRRVAEPGAARQLVYASPRLERGRDEHTYGSYVVVFCVWRSNGVGFALTWLIRRRHDQTTGVRPRVLRAHGVR